MSPVATTDRPRLDVWLAADRNITRHAAQTLIDAGLVTVNGRLGRPGQRVRDGDLVRIDDRAAGDAVGGRRPSRVDGGHAASSGEGGGAPEAAGPAAPLSPVNIVFEDEWLAVVNKPAGLVVHPAPGHLADTLVDALKARGTTWSLLGGAERAGIVHRLDRDTSGLLVVAKTEAAHRSLAQQLRDRTLGRTYWAVVNGGFREETGTIDAPIGRDRRDRKRMAVVDGGRAAVTDFRVVERLGDMSVLEVTLRSGRTHQIRVHMAYIRHPIAGDAVYGRGGPPGRPALHAAHLTVAHPATGTVERYSAPLPPELAAFVDELRRRR